MGRSSIIVWFIGLGMMEFSNILNNWMIIIPVLIIVSIGVIYIGFVFGVTRTRLESDLEKTLAEQRVKIVEKEHEHFVKMTKVLNDYKVVAEYPTQSPNVILCEIKPKREYYKWMDEEDLNKGDDQWREKIEANIRQLKS